MTAIRRRPARRAALPVPALLALLASAAPAFAVDGPALLPAPAQLGVQVEKPAGDGVHYSQGSGIFLGQGMVLTAAHVVEVDPGHTKVTVLLDGRRIDGTLVADGHADKLDLALIKLPAEALSPQRQAQATVPVCAGNPGPNQPVVVSAQGAISMAATIPTPITTDLQTTTWTNLLSTGYHHGSSGGPVFSPQQGCLWGILYQELSGTPQPGGPFLDLTAFVPASKITPFLEEYRRKAGGGRP